jgi:mRNA interferase RelE/StbE
VRDIERLPSRIQAQVLARIEEMSDDLKGDVKRLTNFTPEFRLREVEEKTIVIYRIHHRREAYR